MPKRADSLVLATLRTEGPENRLTELFGVALAEHLTFARRVFREVGLELPQDEQLALEVRTQLMVPLGIVDLAATAWSGDRIAARLWCEDKKGAPFQPQQLERYIASMPPGNGRLAAVVREKDVANVSEYCARADAALVTWEGVAAMAYAAGRDTASRRPRWRVEAAGPRAQSQQRILSDFLGYLEKELSILTEPLTTAHAGALRDVGPASAAARLIFDQGIERSNYEKVPGREWPTPSRSDPPPGYQDCHLRSQHEGPGAWLEGWFELMRHPFEAIVGEPPDDQAFLVGITLSRDVGEILFREDLELWRAEIRNAAELARSGFRVFHRPKWVHVWRPLFLVELATKCSSLDDQIQYLADWINESLGYIVNHPPPH